MAGITEAKGARTFTTVKRRAAWNIDGEPVGIYKVVTVSVKDGKKVVWRKSVSSAFIVDHTVFQNPLFGGRVRHVQREGRREALKTNILKPFRNNR